MRQNHQVATMLFWSQSTWWLLTSFFCFCFSILGLVLVAKKKPHGGFKFGFDHQKIKSHNDHYVIIFLSQPKPPCGHQVEFELMVIKLFLLSI